MRYYLSRWRAELPAHLRYSRNAPQPQPLTPPSPRRAARMLLKAEGETKAEYRAFTEGLCGLCPDGIYLEFLASQRCKTVLFSLWGNFG